ncbi:IS200/IS605 family transposase [Candidatus Pacearchaeota archaeon CG10_big_fil_rev_8_21_14_0_10_34_76]|nr:MAG: IS200/IS605 family transposase [Candidatus Pacearchaeota archaeon CG10_big_fil_rev_8_21_14_0_10_34_76]
MELERACHGTYRIRYHRVFVLKYRKKLFLKKVPVEYGKEPLKGIGERYWFKFDAIGMEEDHLHIVVGTAPRYAPSEVMQIIKSIIAWMIFKRFREIKRELWGGEFWSDGCHIDKVSDHGGLDKIKKYVEDSSCIEKVKHQIQLILKRLGWSLDTLEPSP